MQISPLSIAPVVPPSRSVVSRTANAADPAGFASLLRQTVEAPAAIRAPSAPPPPVLPPARPPTSASPTQAGTPPAAASAPKNEASAPGGKPSDAADDRSTRAPDASDPPAATAGGMPAPGRGLTRARSAAADARADTSAAASADPAPSDAASGPVDTSAAEAAGDKPRKAETRSASDAANGTSTLPLPTPPAQTPPLGTTPVPDAGRTPRALEPRGAAGADGSALPTSLGTPATLDTASATGSRGAQAGAARDAGASSVDALGDDPATTTALPAALPPSGSAFAGLLAEHRQGADTGATSHAATAVDGTAAAGGASAFAAAPVFGTNAPQAAQVAAPVGSPDFAQQLGVQISVLAKDGVQHAELHLNPADMGPVSVQITMDGTQARIDFGAEVAATRQAIENGLPQLASALADAGFTLAGGGVSQHGGGSGREQPGGGSRASGSRATEPVTAAAPTRRVATVGGLDLYA